MFVTVGGRGDKSKTRGQRYFAGRNTVFAFRRVVRHFFHSVYAGIVISSVLLAACGSGSSDAGNNVPPAENHGEWVSIKSPTSQNQYSIANNQVTLGGTASILCDYGCPGAGSSTASKIGVTVSWTNTTSGVGGGSSQSVDVCWFFGSYYCNHTWSATVPLVPGDNLIRVAASSQDGWGYDYILVQMKGSVPPTVKSISASNISAYTARVSVDVETGALATVVNTDWSLDANFTNIVFSMSTTLASAPYKQTAQFEPSSLQYGTDYFVRASAYNADGSSGALTTSFTTSTNVSPVAHTLDATSTTLTSASLNSEINPMGFATDTWFEWGTDSGLAGASETPHAPVGSGKTFTSHSSWLTGLVGGTTYYYRAHASSGMGTGTGTIKSFVASTVPTVSTYDASNIGTDTVALRGSVNPNYDPAEAWFEWGTDNTLTTYTSTTPESVGAGGSGSIYSKPVSGLSPSQTYYYRVAARNGHGEIRGSIVSVTSLAATPPSTSAVTVDNMTSTTATFNGTVNPNGLATNAWFEWGTDSTLATYAATSPVALDYPAVDNNVSTPLSGLTYNVTYYVRAVASNSAGTTRGAITSFQTVTPPTVQTQAATSALARSGTLNGAVNPNGSGTTAWFEVGWDPNLSTLFRFSTTSQGMGNGTVTLPLASTLNDLSSNTTYYYRAVGTNAGATVNGAILSFTTPEGNYGCWSKTYGRYAYQSNDVGQAIAATSDGGMIITGKSTPHYSFPPGAWMLKLGPEGGVQWQELFINTPYDVPVVKEVASGGYLVGTTTLTANSRELWLIKLDANGQVEWEKSLVNGYQTIGDIDVLSDGYVVTATTGTTLSVHRLASDGTVVWRETFDGIASGSVVAVDAVSDGFLIATTGAGLGAGGDDIWVLKLAQDGTPQWQYTYGGSGDERASDVLATADGIFVMGTTDSFGSGQDDIWVLRLTVDGTVTAEQVYGTSAADSGGSIKAVGSVYLAAGKTNGRLWLASLGADGSIAWQKDYPIGPTAWPNSVDLTSDSGFVVASGTTDINATRLPGDGACPGFDADSTLTRAATIATRTATSIAPGSLPATANDLSVAPTATYAKILQTVPVP